MAQFPSTTSASDVWNLTDVYRARAGSNWPSVITVPSAPTIGTATGGNAQAVVTFTPPTNDGGSAITGYRVTSTPSGITATGSSSPITITGLTNGTSYTFTVAAQNLIGYSAESAASNSVTPAVTVTPTVEYLVVAGGGGGAADDGGGGGAGGLRTASGFAVSSGSAITVTVGAGGAYATRGSPESNTAGSDSIFSSITSTGGGAGHRGGSAPSKSNGGSGGGGGYSSGIGGTGISGQGYAGGNAGSYTNGGGGGGAGAVGQAGIGSTNSGAGGVGISSSITGTATYYAGGGGGGSRDAGGAGGNGGGGSGRTNAQTGSAGTANTGGGGGGSGDTNFGGQNDSWAGGSGVVIIRYSDSYSAATSTTGSPTITVTGGYRIYKWTSSGSITF
jgi:hypothetical protein